jgi:hypothetical protein
MGSSLLKAPSSIPSPSTHILIARSFSMPAEAIIFLVGCTYIVHNQSILDSKSHNDIRESKTDCNRKDHVPMTFQDLFDLPRLKIPDVDFVILTTANDPSRFRRPMVCDETGRDTIRSVGMSGVGLHTARGIHVPQTDGGILR